jgi:hypothetical protein
MNTNSIVTDGFSCAESAAVYKEMWPAEPAVRAQYEDGAQCGGCSYFAPLNADWGICCHPGSRHRLETVFEHFTCPSYLCEGWGPHSFSDAWQCECGGIEIKRKNEPN